ncbi:MAG: hypothetical protein IT393_04265 [Nitrospirae bacterium]|nr:hypothetical protein [Nitrospirota bacterium]
MKKREKPPKNEVTCLTKRQKKFAEHIVNGLTPQTAYLASGYRQGSVTARPYRLLQSAEIREYIQSLIDPHLPAIIRNDIQLAKLKVHKGEGKDIPPSLIEGAKERLYNRSSLGPVTKKIEERKVEESLTVVDLSGYRSDRKEEAQTDSNTSNSGKEKSHDLQ